MNIYLVATDKDITSLNDIKKITKNDWFSITSFDDYGYETFNATKEEASKVVDIVESVQQTLINCANGEYE